jgi:hypothetical protein
VLTKIRQLYICLISEDFKAFLYTNGDITSYLQGFLA